MPGGAGSAQNNSLVIEGGGFQGDSAVGQPGAAFGGKGGNASGGGIWADNVCMVLKNIAFNATTVIGGAGAGGPGPLP